VLLWKRRPDLKNLLQRQEDAKKNAARKMTSA